MEIKAYDSKNNPYRAILEWTKDGPKISLKAISNELGIVSYLQTFGFHQDAEHGSIQFKFDKPILVEKTPILIASKKYDEHAKEQVIMYPPSTEGWYAKVIDGIKPVFLFIQRIIRKPKLRMLTITNDDCDEIILSFPVNTFEVEWLFTEPKHVTWEEELLKTHTTVVLDNWVETMLSLPAPNYRNLMELTNGVQISDLRPRGTSMKETLEPLLPSFYQGKIREQLMAFLAWTTTNPQPFTEDPVDLLLQFSSSGYLRFLVSQYLMDKALGLETQQYLRYFLNIVVKSDYWQQTNPTKFLNQIKQPELSHEFISVLKNLSKVNRIPKGLPVRKQDAIFNKDLWITRMRLIQFPIVYRATIDYPQIGLIHTFRLQRAYRWPHRHTWWSFTFDEQKVDYPNRVSFSLIPKGAFDRIQNDSTSMLNKHLSQVIWQSRNNNIDAMLKSDVRISPVERIRKKIGLESSIKKMKRKYTPNISHRKRNLDSVDVIALDYLQTGISLFNLEDENYVTPIGNISNDVLYERISKIIASGLAQPDFLWQGLQSSERSLNILKSIGIYIEAKEDSTKVGFGLAQLLLDEMPTSDIRILDDGRKIFCIVRYGDVNELKKLEEFGKDIGLSMKIELIHDLLHYGYGMLTRLWRNEEWDSDISGLLSQDRTH